MFKERHILIKSNLLVSIIEHFQNPRLIEKSAFQETIKHLQSDEQF